MTNISNSNNYIRLQNLNRDSIVEKTKSAAAPMMLIIPKSKKSNENLSRRDMRNILSIKSFTRFAKSENILSNTTLKNSLMDLDSIIDLKQIKNEEKQHFKRQ